MKNYLSFDKHKLHKLLLIWKQSKVSEIKKARLLLVRSDADCSYIYHDRVYSPIIDSLVDIANNHCVSSISISSPYSKYHGSTAYNNPLVFNRSFFWIELIAFFNKIFCGSRAAIRYKKKSSIKIWIRILKKIEPNIVIAIQPSNYLCAAARELHIKVYDYQHGVIAKDHLWYGEKLHSIFNDEELPAGIICWDKSSANSLNMLVQNRGLHVLVLGNPWVDRFINQVPNDNLVQEACSQKFLSESCRPSILVSLQWGLKKHYYRNTDFNGLMCDALIQVIKKTSCEYNWLLRLHPVQLHGPENVEVRNQLINLFGDHENIDWDNVSRLPLPVVMKKIRLHITDMSTVVKEAAWFSIPSAILNPLLKKGQQLQSLFIEEREFGIATLIDQSETDIHEWIKFFLEKPAGTSNKSNQDFRYCFGKFLENECKKNVDKISDLRRCD